MKHFFDTLTPVDPPKMKEFKRQAREELKKRKMTLDEMKTKLELICFNSSTVNDYVPTGMKQLIVSKSVLMGEKVPSSFAQQIDRVIKKMNEPPFAYILANIQTKGIKGYLDILFDLRTNFDYKPVVITHFADDELLDYLCYFLELGGSSGVERKIEIFDERGKEPWKTVRESAELITVDRGKYQPAVLERPFFSEIHLRIKKGDQSSVFSYPYGKLKTVISYFNRYIEAGVIHRAKNILFISWKDIEGFKLSSAQSRIFLGISLRGEFIPVSQLITKNVGLDLLKKEDIDFFQFKIGRQKIDVRTDEIIKFEINLDTQQIIIHRGVTKDDYHISRFRRIKLYRGKQSVTIHKVVSFNRGESNFEQIQTFLGIRYTQNEKIRQLRQAAGELNFLATRNVVSCGHMANLALSSMNLLGILPLKVRCIGFSPADIEDKKKVSGYYTAWFEQLKEELKLILDLSSTPNFTDHNFSLRTKNIKQLLGLKTIDHASSQILENSSRDLEEVIRYMDNFFKLDLYNKFEDNLESDSSTEVDSFDADAEQEYEHLDDEARSFISQNFAFFKKRELAQKAILLIEQMLFYSSSVKKHVEDEQFEPDLIVYSTRKDALENFRYASFPATSLAKIINEKILKNSSLDEELTFVKFMRGFTKKVFNKGLELNKSFHHQYKNTLAELGFHLEEKRGQLLQEIEFLENPDNREQVYTKLLKQVTKMFFAELEAKSKNIEALTKEKKELGEKIEQFKGKLERLLDQEINVEKLPELLPRIIENLQEMRVHVFVNHNKKKRIVEKIFTPYVQLNENIIHYFTKAQQYTDLFQKALWIRHKQQLFAKLKEFSQKLITLPPERLNEKIGELSRWQYDSKKEQALRNEIAQDIQKINQQLEELKQLPVHNLFNQKGLESGDLIEYLKYFEKNSNSLVEGVAKLQTLYLKLNSLQNALFKKQGDLVKYRIQVVKNKQLVLVIRVLLQDPQNQKGVEELLELHESVPSEIKVELNQLRSKLNLSLKQYKEVTTKEYLSDIVQYKELYKTANHRHSINEVVKELTNYTQGLAAVGVEIEGEKRDLDYLKTQEDALEGFVMSKTLPSTRVLLKTQYLPLVETEIKLLKKANTFLDEILSKGNALKKELSNTYFNKRYGIHQFANGNYCYDSSRGTRNHIEKNIFSAQMLWAENHRAGFLPASGTLNKISFKKIEIIGFEGVKGAVENLWKGSGGERVLFLPSTLTFDEALDICSFKEMVSKENPKTASSLNSLILVYVGVINFKKLQESKKRLNQYHSAILSNIFIEIDDVQVFNNKQSIFEAIVTRTVGSCNDNIAPQIYKKLLYEN
jgi:hypothetical protein